jgi:hypothetical protein
MSSVRQNVIKHKVGLLNLAADLGDISRASKVMGLSRDTFYRYQSPMESGGIEALIDANRRKPNPKNRLKKQPRWQWLRLPLMQPGCTDKRGKALPGSSSGIICRLSDWLNRAEKLADC